MHVASSLEWYGLQYIICLLCMPEEHQQQSVYEANGVCWKLCFVNFLGLKLVFKLSVFQGNLYQTKLLHSTYLWK